MTDRRGEKNLAFSFYSGEKLCLLGFVLVVLFSWHVATRCLRQPPDTAVVSPIRIMHHTIKTAQE